MAPKICGLKHVDLGGKIYLICCFFISRVREEIEKLEKPEKQTFSVSIDLINLAQSGEGRARGPKPVSETFYFFVPECLEAFQ